MISKSIYNVTDIFNQDDSYSTLFKWKLTPTEINHVEGLQKTLYESYSSKKRTANHDRIIRVIRTTVQLIRTYLDITVVQLFISSRYSTVTNSNDYVISLQFC